MQPIEGANPSRIPGESRLCLFVYTHPKPLQNQDSAVDEKTHTKITPLLSTAGKDTPLGGYPRNSSSIAWYELASGPAA
jgi:hypothetical protein